jgi:spore maturation protein CgeB
MKVLICSGGRYESQANAQVCSYIRDGWKEYLGDGNVVATNISGAAAVVAAIKPEIIFGIGSYLPESTYFGEVCGTARRIGAVTVFWATEDPYEQDASYRIQHDFDVVFSCDRWGTNFYSHKHAYHLPLAGCQHRHYIPINANAQRPIDILFCGVAFSSRHEIVKDLCSSLSGLNISFIGPGWGQFGPGFSDRRIDNAELINLYSRSKIVLNLGRSLHFENKRYMIVPSSPGPRTFEAALAGTVQFFHEDTYEIRRYFRKDELPSFSNKREFDDLLNIYLNSDEVCLQTAERAQKRAVAEHTYAHRARYVVDTLKIQGLL